MRIRRVVMDVDKAVQRPDVMEVGAAIEKVEGVETLNITVTEIDIETVGMDITVEGDGIDWPGLLRAIERTGAVVHSVDQLVAGVRIIEGVKRAR
ncbi:hypothetical protein GCM10022252_15770 [Streptosporangium oxazolinicum]|uniref:DUF211 domain-containing protein n=1 Tax=Streptosporangium oxazolinicum TaxID=909287 RepID=A0ABP8AKB6_9ACTN